MFAQNIDAARRQSYKGRFFAKSLAEGAGDKFFWVHGHLLV
jgi:hypothetical protein